MLAIIDKYKERILVFCIICLLLPVCVTIGETVLHIGRATGTVLRMYAEGVCQK